jgi:hypothetical protein
MGKEIFPMAVEQERTGGNTPGTCGDSSYHPVGNRAPGAEAPQAGGESGADTKPMICDKCGHKMKIGDYPFCPHQPTMRSHPFVSWVDENLGEHPVEITGLAQWNRMMKANNLELRDGPTKGDLEARRDKCEEIKKELRHAR